MAVLDPPPISLTEESAQHNYKSIAALASQIDSYIKNSASNESLFQPRPILLRKRLKDKCTSALLSSELAPAQLDKVEGMLWNQGFYRVIQKCRNSQAIQGDTPLCNAYRTHITAGIGFYTSLLAKMTDTHSLSAAGFLDWNCCQDENNKINKTTNKQLELYIYKYLIHLGDLSRYQQFFTQNSDLTKRFYYQAIILNPYLGHAYNQLGTMYSGLNFNLDSVYFYLRALACTDSMVALSETNIKLIYSKNRVHWDNINALPLCVDASEDEQNERVIKRFILGFIHLQEVFSTIQSSTDMEYMCSRVLKDFEECLTIEQFFASNNNTGNECVLATTVGGDPLFKICLISILTSHILRAHGSTHTPSATSFAIAMFSLLLQAAINRVRRLVSSLSEAQTIGLTATQILSAECEQSSSDNAASIDSLHVSSKQTEVPPDEPVCLVTEDSPRNVDGSDSEPDVYTGNNSNSKQNNSSSGSSGKRASRVKRGTAGGGDSDCDLSEGNVSDSILSSRSNSSSSGFEILGSDHSSEDEEIYRGRCEKSQFDDNSKPLVGDPTFESTPIVSKINKLLDVTDNLNSPMLSSTADDESQNSSQFRTQLETDSFNTSEKRVNSCIERPKIMLAAKFSLEEVETSSPPPPPPQTAPEAAVYISNTLTKLSRAVQDESTLLVARAFSLWLNKHPVILATCAQNCAMLWSHLATLLNFLPSTSEFIQHGVFPQFKSSPDTFSLATDWSQSHPLYEDKLLYGFLQEEALSTLDNMFTSSTPAEEQSLTRLIYLRRFGLLMADNKMAPAFTFESSDQLFMGPAQKEVLEAKIAEETKLIEQSQSREKQNNLIRALAHQRLRGQVDSLRTQQQHLNASALPYILIPDALSLCNQLNTLKRLVNSKKFILIIANVTLRILDDMKGQKQNFHVRQALRYIEHEFEGNGQTVRPQVPTGPSNPTSGRDKRRHASNNPTVNCIKELFEVGTKHAGIEGKLSSEAVCLLFDDNILQNFLSPGGRTYHQFTQVIEKAAETGVVWMSVPEFFYKWVAIKKE